MMPSDMTDTPALLFMDIMELIKYVARDYTLKQFEIIIASRDIITDDQKVRCDVTTFTSKYDNIDFAPYLAPSSAAMNYRYDPAPSNIDKFEQAYDNQLTSIDIFTDVLCIADMVVNSRVPVIILYTQLDNKCGYPKILREFIEDKFDLKSYTVDDILDPDIDVTNIGDVDVIKKHIAEEKTYLSESNTTDAFYNYLTESISAKYKDVLGRKSVGQLMEIAAKNNVVVSKKASKEEIINRIMRQMER